MTTSDEANPEPLPDHESDLLGPLMILTFTTGVLDAVSVIGLGRVFVANMTGNIVFLGFALGGAEGFSVRRSIAALLAFIAGAVIAGHWANRRIPGSPRRQLAIAAAAEAALVLMAAAFTVGRLRPPTADLTFSLVIVLSIAMGIRNSMVRKLRIIDVTTTLLTMALSGLAGDSLLAGGSRERAARRALSILAMFTGAVAGAMLLLKWDVLAPLVLAGVLALAAALMASRRAVGTEREARLPLRRNT